MKHMPNNLDVAADLRRCLYSSYSDNIFKDENVKGFLKKAEINLNLIKEKLDSETYFEVKKRIERAKDGNNLPHKRREDLLIASCLLL